MRKKVKDIILIIILWLNMASFVFFVCSLDSNSDIPFIVCLINLIYIFLFAYANGIIKLRG